MRGSWSLRRSLRTVKREFWPRFELVASDRRQSVKMSLMKKAIGGSIHRIREFELEKVTRLENRIFLDDTTNPLFFPSLPIPSLLVSIVPRSLLMALLMANMIFRSIRSTKTVGPVRKGWINTINVIYSAVSGTITRSFSGFSDCLILHRNWFDYWFFFLWHSLMAFDTFLFVMKRLKIFT